MRSVRRREIYFVEMDLIPEQEQVDPGSRETIGVYMMNLRSRCLTNENLDSVSVFIPELVQHLRGPPAPQVTSIAKVRRERLCSPFTYEDEDVENSRRCPLVERPARVMVTPAGFRLPAGQLLFPVHPQKVHIRALKADRRNNIFALMSVAGPFNRVVAPLYRATEEEVKGCFRVSDYSQDGQMILSVLCAFWPPCGGEGGQGGTGGAVEKERKKEVTDEGQKCLRL